MKALDAEGRRTQPLRIAFFGTPEIALPTLEGLIAGPHEIVGIVSQPDRPRGRGRKLSPSPVSAVAIREGLPLLRPEAVGDPETVEALAALAPDLGVVVAFGQFIPKRIRELPNRGYLINAHASLLPKYRGAAPIARAILDGVEETGISVMRIEKEMDAGPVALVARTAIGPTENTDELSQRLAQMAATVIAEAVDRIAHDEIEWSEQDARSATFAAKIEKADAILDLRQPARALAQRIHALSPKPGGEVTLVSDASEQTVIKISSAEVAPFEERSAPHAGSLDRSNSDAPLRIATGQGWLLPRVLKRPGGKAVAVADFLRGFEIPDGARLLLADEEEPEKA
ncbi:MAG: methionyl-tRNA formyltransferase [bacterium]|nr:methionyl-tRNA formyltransferase [bacterium]